MKNLIDITDFGVDELFSLIDTANDIIANPKKYAEACKGKKLATLFFEPSTRTRLSFEAAMLELGGSVIGFSEASSSSAAKGESIADTAKVVSCYADIIAMRSPIEGAALVAANNATVPVINAGDGANQHPSQTMLDLYSIYKTQGRINDLTITMVGDLKYGRTVHSLLMAMQYFNPTFNFIASKELQMPEEYKDLIVRVAGYSDHFRNLSKALQDEIIERTEQSFN